MSGRSDISRIVPRSRYDSNVAISEECSCGAVYEVLYPFLAAQQLAEWRANHRHDMAAAVARVQATTTAPTTRPHDAEETA